MIVKSDSVLSQPTFEDYPPQSTSADQQIQRWGHLSSAEPVDFLAAPASEPTLQHGIAPFDGSELTLEQIAELIDWPMDPALTQAQPANDIPQAPSLPVAPLLQTPGIVSPQPVLAPQATLVPQSIPLPQPPQPVSQLVFQYAPPPQIPLGPSKAMEAAIEAKNKLMIFRLHQIHKPSMRNQPYLRPYSDLGLKRGQAEEYQAVVEGGVPLFVFETADWDTAMKLLTETAFHVFRREELEKAEREGRILPPMEPKLAFYVHFFPLTEEIDHCLSQL
ncbi:unnamed protein product [Rhizoctonia solani]|uniref:Uncharacterized protein n=1 Tax=Rhizoctonia solani TaxID=456999 RepID=A0A8H3C4Z8_9AGAM|nr:unnamed protein product [Rhizoctonia solani]